MLSTLFLVHFYQKQAYLRPIPNVFTQEITCEERILCGAFSDTESLE